MCYADFDTAIFRSAVTCQEDYIIVKHKKTGWEKRFKGVSKFYGLGKSHTGGWIGEQNAEREGTDKPQISADDFEISYHHELKNQSVEELIESSLQEIDFVVGRIKRTMDAEDYRLCIGGKGNYRHDLAQVLPYKANRGEKPILFQEIREAFIQKYKSKVIVADGIEAEDILGIEGFNAYLRFQKTGIWDTVICYIDKDVDQVYCPRFNYDKTQEGIKIPTPQECMFSFCKQLLIGDRSTDNIPGLPELSNELKEKYQLRKYKGFGAATAEKLLEGKGVKEMFEVVVEAYKSYFGEEKKEFISHRCEVLNWNWLDYLNDTARLVYLQKYEDEVYDIRKTLDKLKIQY